MTASTAAHHPSTPHLPVHHSSQAPHPTTHQPVHPTHSPVNTTPHHPRECRHGWIKSSSRPNKCYFLDRRLQANVSFFEAVDFCASVGGAVLGVANAFENSELRALLIDRKSGLGAWLGLKNVGGKFRWVNGETSPFRHWRGSQEPHGEDCAAITERGDWVGVPCRGHGVHFSQLPVICQQHL